LIFRLSRRAHGGAAGHHRGTAGVAAVTVGDFCSVTMHHPHMFDRDLQLVGDDLAERGGDALTHRVTAGIKDDLASVVDFDPRVLPRANTARLDEAADADANGAAFFLGFR